MEFATRKEIFLDAIAKGKEPEIEPLTREELLLAEHAKREASGGSGSGSALGGADWNAAEGEPGHVLNRTHYTEMVMGELLPETTVEIDPEGGQGYLTEPVLSVKKGEEYTVTWNGTEYKCVAQEVTQDGVTGIVLGNPVAVGGADSGEPFVILCASAEQAAHAGVSIIIIPLDGSTSVTFAIKGNVEIVHPLDAKYIGNLRGQKEILLNLNTGECNVPFSEVLAMEPGEIQASLRVEGSKNTDGAIPVYSVFGVTKNVAEFNGILYSSISFNVYIDVNGAYSGLVPENSVPCSIRKYEWNSNSLQSTEYDSCVVFAPREDNSGVPDGMAAKTNTLVCVFDGNSSSPDFQRLDRVPLDGIVLRSRTTGSYKNFLITVDDSGTLKVSEVSGNL